VLACGDSPRTRAAAFTRVRDRTLAPVISVRTKADLPENRDESVSHRHDSCSAAGSVDRFIAVSAETGTGLNVLLDAITDTLGKSLTAIPNDAPLLTRARHQRAVEEAIHELRAFRTGWIENGLPGPVAATHLRSAAMALEELIGAVDVEDVLDRVFSTFCVGK